MAIRFLVCTTSWQYVIIGILGAPYEVSLYNVESLILAFSPPQWINVIIKFARFARLISWLEWLQNFVIVLGKLRFLSWHFFPEPWKFQFVPVYQCLFYSFDTGLILYCDKPIQDLGGINFPKYFKDVGWTFMLIAGECETFIHNISNFW